MRPGLLNHAAMGALRAAAMPKGVVLGGQLGSNVEADPGNEAQRLYFPWLKFRIARGHPADRRASHANRPTPSRISRRRRVRRAA